jgi:hypothetical protein
MDPVFLGPAHGPSWTNGTVAAQPRRSWRAGALWGTRARCHASLRTRRGRGCSPREKLGDGVIDFGQRQREAMATVWPTTPHNNYNSWNCLYTSITRDPKYTQTTANTQHTSRYLWRPITTLQHVHSQTKNWLPSILRRWPNQLASTVWEVLHTG